MDIKWICVKNENQERKLFISTVINLKTGHKIRYFRLKIFLFILKNYLRKST